MRIIKRRYMAKVRGDSFTTHTPIMRGKAYPAYTHYRDTYCVAPKYGRFLYIEAWRN